MRVGLFLADHQPTEGGGYTFQESVSRAFLRNVRNRGHDYIVFSSARSTTRIENVKHVVVPARSVAARSARLAGAIRGRRVSALQQAAAEERAEFMWFVSGHAEVIDIPYLATVWDLQHRLQPWFPEVSANGEWQRRERLLRPFLQRAAGVITGTEVGKREIIEFYAVPGDRIHILPHPAPSFDGIRVPTETELRSRYQLTKPFVLYPAQFWPHKNHITLVHALKMLKEQHQLDLDLVLVGSDKGAHAHVQEVASQLAVASSVRFLGFVPTATLIGLYRTAVALTYVSLFGPENLPPLEAFTCRCPVIAAEVAGVSEQLGNAALIVDGLDPAAIASAIATVYTDVQLRAQLIECGGRRAAEWTADDYCRGVATIIDQFARVRRCWR